MRAALPAGEHVLNDCTDRYRFAVAFAACVVAKKVSLLPSTHTLELIRRLAQLTPDVFCVTDDPRCEIDLPRVYFPDTGAIEHGSWSVPQIEGDQLCAHVFTSGSTGDPLPHRKTWGRLVSCVTHESRALGLQAGGYAIVGTVPAQHMYGFESTVLLALHTRNPLTAARPFYPADIASALAAAPRPRVLVSTPVHLRALLGADVPLPAVDAVVSATAPLSMELAREVEARLTAPLLEIYGSTETGQIASRRTTQSPQWTLFEGVQLTERDGRMWARGGHIEQPTPLCDVIEIRSATQFLLHGRLGDLVNIAGKRSSLGYLESQLNALPGVLDGAFFLREEGTRSSVEVTRVGAMVVAPGLDGRAILEQLRKRIDPVFLPRPLLFVDRLPRNGTGKLSREALHSLLNTTKRPSAKEA